jgi:hypothetical protein
VPGDGQRAIIEHLQERRHVDGIHAPEHHIVPGRAGSLELQRQAVEHGGILRAQIARMQRLIIVIRRRLPGDVDELRRLLHRQHARVVRMMKQTGRV